jgi:hypothetical protein
LAIKSNEGPDSFFSSRVQFNGLYKLAEFKCAKDFLKTERECTKLLDWNFRVWEETYECFRDELFEYILF